MRIGILASVGEMVDSFFSDFIASWTMAGHEVSVAAGTVMHDSAGRIIEGLTRRPGLGVARAWSGIRQWVQDERLDVVLTNAATASAVARTARLQIPVVYFCHGLHWNQGRGASDRLWQSVERLLLLKTAGVVTINSDDHTWFKGRLSTERILRLHNGVGLRPDAYPRVPPPQVENVSGRKVLKLAWIGEFSPRKRPHLVLDVADSLREAGVDFALEMIGEGLLLESVNEAIHRLGLENRVTAAGAGDAAGVLAGSHALIHTSAWEGLPRVMMEALAVGRPTYAFDVKGVRDIPQVALFPEGEPRLLARQLVEDWKAGTLLETVSFDPGTLDFSRSAEALELFLQQIVSKSLPARAFRVPADKGAHSAGTPVTPEAI